LLFCPNRTRRKYRVIEEEGGMTTRWSNSWRAAVLASLFMPLLAFAAPAAQAP
jgi:hypothetical protein